jgi:hypothetical protein
MNYANKQELALAITKLPNYEARDFDCSSDAEVVEWLETLDIRDVRDFYYDMNQDWQELR